MYWPVTNAKRSDNLESPLPSLSVFVANYDIIDFIHKALAKIQTTELVIDQDFFLRCGSEKSRFFCGS